MKLRIPASHLVLLAVFLAGTAFVALNGYAASTSTRNLVVIGPVGLAVPVLVLIALVGEWRAGADTDTTSSPTLRDTLMDVVLLGLFGALCYALTRIGFDVATFVFLWVGVVLSGGRGWWQPPVYSAVMTVFLVKAFGALFPYPMTTVVL